MSLPVRGKGVKSQHAPSYSGDALGRQRKKTWAMLVVSFPPEKRTAISAAMAAVLANATAAERLQHHQHSSSSKNNNNSSSSGTNSGKQMYDYIPCIKKSVSFLCFVFSSDLSLDLWIIVDLSV